MADAIGRRDLIKLTAGGAAALASAAAAGPHKFFTPEEYRLVDELTEMIIPADEKSGGARAAAVADYVDARLAEAFAQEERERWRNGLKLVDALSKEMNGKTFLESAPEQRLAALTRMARNEEKPGTPEERFFRDVKSLTIQGYYTSKIGIHDDMGYLGNTFQRGDFAGDLPGVK
ncbi:MAG TPA: gluconate 2-dehydrogenase subunit 3 family protein [Bryobacteraceae bacterium]|jgi:hypothetical protein